MSPACCGTVMRAFRKSVYLESWIRLLCNEAKCLKPLHGCRPRESAAAQRASCTFRSPCPVVWAPVSSGLPVVFLSSAIISLA